MNGKEPTVLVIFGATGDLMRQKLVPALFRLFEKKLLPPAFQIIGFARRDISDDAFGQMVKEMIADLRVPPEQARDFVSLFRYQQGFFDQPEGYTNLAKLLGMENRQWKTCVNKLFYLAVPPEFYKDIFTHISESGLNQRCGADEGWMRIVVEKPFGQDLKTAQELDYLLGKIFKEEQDRKSVV